MRVSMSALNMGAINPNLLGFVKATARNSVRAAISAAPVAAVTDSSTGSNVASVAIPTINTKAIPSGANLASRTAFNTAIGTVHDAIANLRNTLLGFYTPLGIADHLGAHGGAAGVAGTVGAITKVVTGVDGTAGNALQRVEANSALSRQRNNLASLIKAYNHVATAMGVATIPNNTGGKASDPISFGASVTATTAIAAGSVATADLASKAEVDASLTALANTVSHIANKVNVVLRAAGSLAAEPIILDP